MLATISAGIVGLMTVLKIPLLIAVFIAGFKKISSLGILGVLWAILLFLAWDILTPPYVVDLEGAIALGLAPVLAGLLGVATSTAFVIVLAIVYLIALSIVIISFVFF